VRQVQAICAVPPFITAARLSGHVVMAGPQLYYEPLTTRRTGRDGELTWFQAIHSIYVYFDSNKCYSYTARPSVSSRPGLPDGTCGSSGEWIGNFPE
jgi:hypothetical protein